MHSHRSLSLHSSSFPLLFTSLLKSIINTCTQYHHFFLNSLFLTLSLFFSHHHHYLLFTWTHYYCQTSLSLLNYSLFTVHYSWSTHSFDLTWLDLTVFFDLTVILTLYYSWSIHSSSSLLLLIPYSLLFNFILFIST